MFFQSLTQMVKGLVFHASLKQQGEEFLHILQLPKLSEVFGGMRVLLIRNFSLWALFEPI